jgi:hypothetical protein
MATQLTNKQTFDAGADQKLPTSLSQPNNGDAEILTQVGLFSTRRHNITANSVPVPVSGS